MAVPLPLAATPPHPLRDAKPPELRFFFDSSTERRELQIAPRQSRHWIAAAALVISTAATILPARSASRILPVEILRFE